jgi:carboxymethylenebutenolidase
MARDAFAKIDQAKASEDWIAAARQARAVGGGSAKLGAVGCRYGGTMVSLPAVRLPELTAAAPFYGGPPQLDQVGWIKAELAVSHAGNATHVWSPAGRPTRRHCRPPACAMAVIYPGAEHGFHNDTTPRFDEKLAQSAWRRTSALFNRTMRG